MNIEDAFKTVFDFKSFMLHRLIMDVFQLNDFGAFGFTAHYLFLLILGGRQSLVHFLSRTAPLVAAHFVQ
ncbi:hypothetical protein CFP56_026884 [Quercus suber]|uniref:Uncharacterized protein n=1 Tax=Quercus suber TaxID=58331 RepID=A0AAW0LVJ0_QUESU